MSRGRVYEEAHSDVAVAIAERFLCQPRDMTWEDRCDELATAAIEAMQLFIQLYRERDCDELTGCGDDQTWANVSISGLSAAIAAGTRSAETGETQAQSGGCQSGGGVTAASPNPSPPSSPSGISREDEG